MENQGLKTLVFVLPVAFVGLILTLLRSFNESLSLESLAGAFVIIAVGIIVFTFLVFRVIETREAEIRQRSRQLAALHDAALALTRQLELSAVLQTVVDQARDLVGARYGALGVLEEDGRYIDQFITSGLSPVIRAKMGELPQGHGLLGELITTGNPLRVPKIGSDPRSAGFPPNHPPMTTLLGMPIRFKGEILGDLYLTDKQGPSPSPIQFSDADQQILEMFATQAAIAIKNAQLYRESQQLIVLKERERFGMDLHDGVIQSIYAIGLLLENTRFQVDQDPGEVKNLLGQAIQGLDAAIHDIRGYILDLQPERFVGRGLIDGIQELIRELKAHSFLQVTIELQPDAGSTLSGDQINAVLHIGREALSNIRKHARAGKVIFELTEKDQVCRLCISDNGVGFDPENVRELGRGIGNMRERAAGLAGQLNISQPDEGGTMIVLDIPV